MQHEVLDLCGGDCLYSINPYLANVENRVSS